MENLKLGKALLLNEDRLRELGLTVLKTPVFDQSAGRGLISTFHAIALERRDEKFSLELIRFLGEIDSSPEEIQWLEQRAAHRGTKN